MLVKYLGNERRRKTSDFHFLLFCFDDIFPADAACRPQSLQLKVSMLLRLDKKIFPILSDHKSDSLLLWADMLMC